jgi:dipeptidyl aminopeptidase/acylaminoacyl peptidase
MRYRRRAASTVAFAVVTLFRVPGAAPQTVPAAPAPVTPETLLSLRFPSDLQLSPDGTRLAFVVTEPPQGTNRPRHVWLLDVATGAARQFTFSTKTEGRPRWSPDGKQLAFLSDRGDFTQVYLISADAGEARALTQGKRAVQSFAWSPDGARIAFLAPDPRTEAEEKKAADKDDAQVVDRDDKHARLWIQAVGGGEARAVSPANWEVGEPQWLPSGDQVLASATDHPGSDQWNDRFILVSATDGTMRELLAPTGPFGDPLLAPDGKTLYYVGTRVDGPVPHDLMVFPIAGGTPRNLTATGLDRPVEQVAWRSNGSLLALVSFGFRNALVEVSTDGARRDLPGLDLDVGTFAAGPSGAIAFVGQSATRPPEIFLWDGHAAPRQVTHLNAALAGATLGKVERYRYQSFDGLQIEAALLTPPGYDGTSRLPLVALIHGGPTGSWRDAIEPWGQLLAARGYAVFYPNVRGSTGYGQKFLEMNRADWGGGDFKDVMAGVDALIARGVADPDRLGIGGWSYGGYMAEWAITQTTRFKAAVSGAGMANLISEFGTEAGPAYDEWFYGLPYERPEGFLKSSPFMYLKHAKTPTLILQGEADRTDPLGQSQELYRGLKRYGVEAELVVYPREPHGLREEKHLLDRLNRIVAWYDRYLKRAGTH